MKTSNDSSNAPTPAGGGSLRLVVKGLGHVPSFKNMKRAILDRNTGNMRTLTDPKAKAWMALCVQSFVLQLWSAFQTEGGATWTGASPHFLTVLLLPEDDCWETIPEIEIRGVLVPPGQEGAEILIERLL